MVREIQDHPPGRRFIDPEAGEILARAANPRAALFLDRDGVINANHGYVHTPEKTDWITGIFDLGREASREGYLLIVITNQAGIARGLYSEAEFLAFTSWVHDEFRTRGAPILATYYCPHHPTEGSSEFTGACTCRKPLPGMLLAATAEFLIEPGRSMLLGDKPSDIAAGMAAGIGVNAMLGEAPSMLVTHVLSSTHGGTTSVALQDFLRRYSGGYNPGSNGRVDERRNDAK